MRKLSIRPQRHGAAGGRTRARERFRRIPSSDTPERGGGIARPAALVAALLVACGVGALAQYFLDRRHGAGRRHVARDRARGATRRRSRDAVRRAKYLEGRAEGVAHKAAHAVPGVGGHNEPLDDTTLAQKVESIAFRKAGVPKDHVSVNAEKGVVYLRGQLERGEQIEDLVRAIAAIEGVAGVWSRFLTPAAPNGGS